MRLVIQKHLVFNQYELIIEDEDRLRDKWIKTITRELHITEEYLKEIVNKHNAKHDWHTIWFEKEEDGRNCIEELEPLVIMAILANA